MEGRTRLESWKEVSSYLGRSIKTCQRWETELGLPIHRLDGTPSARVFADPDELDAWMAEKLNHREAKTKEPALIRRQKTKWVATTAGAVILLASSAVVLWQFLTKKPVSFPSGNLPSVAFLPFENVTGDESLEAWRTALPQLLGFDMAQSRTVGGYPVSSAVLKKLNLPEASKFGPEDLKKIARHVGTEHFVSGSLIRSGNDIITSLALCDAGTGEVIQSFRRICPGEKGLFPAVDELTKKIKVALNVPRRLIAQDIDEDVSQIVTGSPAALKLYSEGLRLDEEGKIEEAVSLYKKATEIDPEFAEAFYLMFLDNVTILACCGDAGTKDEAVRCGKKAFEFSGRLNVRTRGDLIRSYYLEFQKNFPMAIAEYKKLLAMMEDDPVTMCQLAQVYWDLEDYDKVVALLENESAKQESGNISLLANSYARMGAYDQAERTFHDSFSRNHSGHYDFNLLYDQEVCALYQRKFDEAQVYNDRLNSPSSAVANSIRDSKAPIFITQDDFPGAEIELRRIVREGPKSEKIEGLCQLAGLSLTQGRLAEARGQASLGVELAETMYDWKVRKRSQYLLACLDRLSGNLPEALRESEKSCPCYADDDSLMEPGTNTKIVSELDDISCLRYFHLRALITLEMGQLAEFEKHLAEIKQLIDRSQYPKLKRAYYHLLGHKELREKNFDKAINHFWRALNLLPSPYGHEHDIDSAQYYYSLAEAYYQAGKYATALDLYQRVPSYWEQRASSGDLYARSFFRIAKIYDLTIQPAGASRNQVGADKTLAKEYYRKFLSLWKDADQVFRPEVEEAAGRLAALEAEMASGGAGPSK